MAEKIKNKIERISSFTTALQCLFLGMSIAFMICGKPVWGWLGLLSILIAIRGLYLVYGKYSDCTNA